MEQRKLKRIPVSLEAQILVNNHRYATHIINISGQGLHMIVSPGEKPLDLRPGTEYKLAITVPSGDTFHLHCRVRWASDFLHYRLTKIVGLLIINPPPEYKLAITVPSGDTFQLHCKVRWASDFLHYRLTKIVGLLIIDPPPEYKAFFRATLYEVRNDISHSPIAVIGMAGHYPGAPDLKRFWENILARRREFRQIPEQRLPLTEYYDPDPSVPDKTYGSRAAVIDGFEFDWVKRGIPKTVVESTDIAHWLVKEVALQDAGLIHNNLPKYRFGSIRGNTMTGEQTQAEGLHQRWLFVRQAFLMSPLNINNIRYS